MARRRLGLAVLGIGAAMLLGGCHGSWHYNSHGGHHGYHGGHSGYRGHYGRHGGHGRHGGDDWLLPVLAIWALLYAFG